MQAESFRNQNNGDYPGGSVIKSPPAKAVDTGSIPGLGRSPMLQSNYTHVPQLLSLCSRAWEPQLLSPCATTTEARAAEVCAPQKRSHSNEKPQHRSQRVDPTFPN